jgi:Type I restriction modification DNA specificity domain
VKADCIRFQPSEAQHPKFLNYALNWESTQKRTASIVHGVGRPRLNLSEIKSILLPIAPLDEQRRIVAEIEKQFTRLEAGVAALRRVQANLKRYRAAVLKAACEGRLVPTEAELQKSEVKGQKTKASFETGEALLARILTERRENWQGRGQYKEPAVPDTANLPPIPEGWTWTSLDQLLQNITDGDHLPPPQTDSGIPFLVIGNVRTGKLNFEDTRFVARGYYDAIEPYRKPRLDRDSPGRILHLINDLLHLLLDLPDSLVGLTLLLQLLIADQSPSSFLHASLQFIRFAARHSRSFPLTPNASPCAWWSPPCGSSPRGESRRHGGRSFDRLP